MTSPAALEAVRHAAPSDIEREPHDYPIDGVLPRLAFRPGDRREVADLLRACDRAGLVVVPQGARTALGLGRPLEQYDVALSLLGLDRVVEYVPEDLTITVEAGMTLRHLQDTLAERGQYLPVDPPPHDRVTVGGLLATARPGAWRGYLPAARDLVLGMTVALPDGSLPKSGGRVVKNVSGYDLHRMHTGALGALGVIVEASFKLAPRPPATRHLALRARDERSAARLALQAWDAPLAARSVALLSPAAASHSGLHREPYVLLDLAGVEGAVERSVEEARMLAQQAGAQVEATEAEPWQRLRALAGDPAATVLRFGGPATSVGDLVQAAVRAGCRAWGFPAAGSVLAHAEGGLDAATVRALRERAQGLGGFLQVEAASTELRRQVDPFAAGETEAVRALKQQFDPHGTLNRGRWMEGV